MSLETRKDLAKLTIRVYEEEGHLRSDIDYEGKLTVRVAEPLAGSFTIWIAAVLAAANKQGPGFRAALGQALRRGASEAPLRGGTAEIIDIEFG